jgi:hypothetical protein
MDLGNPAAPTLISLTPQTNPASGIDSRNAVLTDSNVLYNTTGNGGDNHSVIYLLDIQDPANPVISGLIDLPGQGVYALVNQHDKGLSGNNCIV